MTAAGPLVSVVTPFYNTDPYLAECIESVLAQTYRHFEYLLVDNQSTDRSGDIAQDYARRDGRIRYVRADAFRPQIPNYNYALRQISPESRYVKVAQADDWLYPSCLAEFVALAEAHPSVGVASSYDLRGSDVYGSGLPPDQSVLAGRDAARLYFLKWLFLFGSPTTVFYRASIVRARQSFYPEGTLHADTEVIFHILNEHDFGFVHQVLSFIRTQEDSITARQRHMADDALDRLIIVQRFGRGYLSESEYHSSLDATLAWYYDELGRRWLAQRLGRPRDEFWKFHERGLRTIDARIQWDRVARAAGGIVLRSLLNPGSLVTKWRGGRRGSS